MGTFTAAQGNLPIFLPNPGPVSMPIDVPTTVQYREMTCEELVAGTVSTPNAEVTRLIEVVHCILNTIPAPEFIEGTWIEGWSSDFSSTAYTDSLEEGHTMYTVELHVAGQKYTSLPWPCLGSSREAVAERALYDLQNGFSYNCTSLAP
ncbi:Nn.00g024390.m01.CDS01 [Neocucurbitaria sp. VM-36]